MVLYLRLRGFQIRNLESFEEMGVFGQKDFHPNDFKPKKVKIKDFLNNDVVEETPLTYTVQQAPITLNSS